MAGDQQHPAAFGLQPLQDVEAFDGRGAAHRLGIAPPGAGEFEQADADVAEVLAQQAFALRGVEFRQAQGKVRARGFAPAAR